LGVKPTPGVLITIFFNCLKLIAISVYTHHP
jgi:hypothetical protein